MDANSSSFGFVSLGPPILIDTHLEVELGLSLHPQLIHQRRSYLKPGLYLAKKGNQRY